MKQKRNTEKKRKRERAEVLEMGPRQPHGEMSQKKKGEGGANREVMDSRACLGESWENGFFRRIDRQTPDNTRGPKHGKASNYVSLW